MQPNVPTSRPHNPITEMFNRLKREEAVLPLVGTSDSPNVTAQMPPPTHLGRNQTAFVDRPMNKDAIL